MKKTYLGKSALGWLKASNVDDAGTRWVEIPGQGNCQISAIRTGVDRWCVNGMYIAGMMGLVANMETGPEADAILNADLQREINATA